MTSIVTNYSSIVHRFWDILKASCKLAITTPCYQLSQHRMCYHQHCTQLSIIVTQSLFLPCTNSLLKRHWTQTGYWWCWLVVVKSTVVVATLGTRKYFTTGPPAAEDMLVCNTWSVQLNWWRRSMRDWTAFIFDDKISFISSTYDSKLYTYTHNRRLQSSTVPVTSGGGGRGNGPWTHAG